MLVFEDEILDQEILRSAFEQFLESSVSKKAPFVLCYNQIMTARQRKKDYLEKLPQIVAALKKGYKPEKIILFGSLLDEKRPSSDIDLFLVKKTTLKRLGDRAVEARKYIPFPEIPVDLIIYTPEEVERLKGNSIMLHQVFKGKVLYG